MEKKQHAAGITRPSQINPTHNTANAGDLQRDKNTRHLQNPAWLLCDLTASKSMASDSAASAPSGSLLGMQSLQPPIPTDLPQQDLWGWAQECTCSPLTRGLR